MKTAPNESIKRLEGVVCAALLKSQSLTQELERERGSAGGAGIAALGALFGVLDFLTSTLKKGGSERLSQTETFTVVDHWGRLTALSTLLNAIEEKSERDGEAARARVETFWRGIAEAALNLNRDLAALGALTRSGEITEWVLGVARSESESVQGSIKRMVLRG